MKKLLAVFAFMVVAAALSFSSVGCGDAKKTTTPATSPTKTPT